MPHRIVSCYSNAFGPPGVREAVRSIRSAGIDRLELALRGHDFGGLVIPESAVVTDEADDATVGAFLDLLRATNVKVSGCNVGGADLRTVEGVERTERRIRFARERFGVPVVVSGAGHPSSPEERRLIVGHLRRIGDLASDLGLTVALETHQGPTQNAAAMLDLMADLDHPALRLNFDTGNIAYYNEGLDPVGELEKVAGLVANVHLKDNRGRYRDWYFPALGDGGAVDFRRVRAILDAVGYVGAYAIEIEGIAGEPEPGPERRLDRVARSVDHLAKSGYFEVVA